MVQINGEKTLQTALAAGLHIPRYMMIMDSFLETNVSTDKEFQRAFNGFYKIRRNDVWREKYYKIFENIRKKPDASFEMILRRLYEQTGRVEASFASKMFATINPNMPIWDKHVLQVLGMTSEGVNPSEKLSNAITIYDKIVLWYREYMMTEEGKSNIEIFDRYLPDYASINSVKKIDYMLWILG